MSLILAVLPVMLLGERAAYAQPAGPVVSAIKIEGNQRVESAAIRIHVIQPVGAPLSEADVNHDIKAIYGMGFFQTVKANLVTERGRNVLIYDVKEQPQISAVKVLGMKAYKTTNNKVVSAIQVHAGAILDPLRVRATEKGIRDFYESHGYLDANVTFRGIPGPNNTAIAEFHVHEGTPFAITSIQFSGNHAFSDKDLRDEMQTTTQGWLHRFTGSGILDRKKLSKDVDRIAAFYYDHGYLNVRVGEPDIITHGHQITIKIAISEGPRFNVGRIGLTGDLKFPKSELRKLITIKRGEPFRGTTLQRDMLKLSDFYSNRGYAFVNVNPKTRLNPLNKTVAVNFDIHPGHVIVVNRIRITGNTKTADKVIRREMRVQEQEPYDAKAIRQSKRKLKQLGYFSAVRISTSPSTQPDKIDLNVNVAEANTATFQVAGGFDSYQSVFGRFVLGNTNLFGGGESAMLSAQIGYLYQAYSVSYTEPWFLNIPLSVSVSLFDTSTDLFTFTQDEAGGSIKTFYPLTQLGFKKLGPFSLEDVDAGLGYEFESVGITGMSVLTPYQIRSAKGYRKLSMLMPSIRRFTVDNPIDPRSGSVERLNMFIGGIGVGQAFIKTVAHARFFYTFLKSPTWGSWVFSPGITYGIGTNLSGPNELPLYERFFPGGVGGQGDVRGYQLYSLGPLVTTYNKAGQPLAITTVGGSQELLSEGEITFPLLSGLGIRGVIFADAGQAYSLSQSMDLTKLQAAFGFGIRWHSPFGPLAIDMAFPINPRPQDLSSVFEIGAGSPL